MKKNSTSINDKYQGFSLVSGGLIYEIIIRIQGRLPGKNDLRNKALIMALITWVPLASLSAYSEYILGNGGDIGFFNDLTMYVRFLFVVPLLILLDTIIDNSFIQYVKTTEKIIKPSHHKGFDKTLSLINKLTDSIIPEIIILIFIYTFIFFNWDNLKIFSSGKFYLVSQVTHSLTASGWYMLLFAMPVYQLLFFRWIWRFLIWVYTVIKFSRFEFHLEAMHADQMAGLAFLNFFPLYYSLLMLAPSSILSSSITMDILYKGANLSDSIYDVIFYIIAIGLLLYAPLLVYIPLLMKTKERGVYLFGEVIIKHNNDYMDKWVYHTPDLKTPLVGSMDHSSLNDINGSYLAAIDMKLVPINLRMLGISLLFILIPFIPLVFTMYAPADLFKSIVNSAFDT